MYQERVYHMIQVRQTDRRRESPDRIATNLKALILSRIGAFYFSKVPKNPFPFHFFQHPLPSSAVITFQRSQNFGVSLE